MGQKDKCEVRLLACRIFLNSGCTLVEADIGTLHSVYLCISQLAAYLNFFECSGTVELKKKNPLRTTEKHVGH